VIAYLGASALVKRYVAERGSRETIALTADVDVAATSIVSRAEVAAALAKAVRIGLVKDDVARNAQRRLAADWPDLARVSLTEGVVERAERLAWEHGLRGYDAVQLASALTWQDSIGEEVMLATFDRQLWEVASGLYSLKYY
jgi:predicted nucleic acid-binding protein